MVWTAILRGDWTAGEPVWALPVIRKNSIRRKTGVLSAVQEAKPAGLILASGVV
jgi:hypothetical protein